MEKNKELKEDNARSNESLINTVYALFSLSRLLTRTEDLEHLMNDEVTDINEILSVINTIQVNTLEHFRFFSNTFNLFRWIRICQT